MRILFHIQSLALRGGMENVTILKANSLAERGLDVAIAFSDDLNYRNTIIRPLSPKVEIIDLKTPLWEPTKFSAIGLIIRLDRIRKSLQKTIETWKPDIVVSTGLLDKYIFPLLRQTNKKYVKLLEYHFVSNHKIIESLAITGKASIGRKLLHWFNWRMLTRLYDYNALLTEEDYKKNAPVGDRRFGYIHNPTTFQIENIIPQCKRDKIVLAVGRLTEQKNFAALLKIWSQTKHRKGWKLRILGEGSQRRDLEKLVADLEIGDSVEMPGFSNNVSDEMNCAAIFAATSLWEGLPLVMVEALASGCAVISYDSPCGPNDIITDKSAGIIVSTGDEGQYAKCLEMLMNDIDLRERLSTAAIRRAKDFSLDRIIGQWIDLYNELLTRKRPS